jgi:hypothetical protein
MSMAKFTNKRWGIVWWFYDRRKEDDVYQCHYLVSMSVNGVMLYSAMHLQCSVLVPLLTIYTSSELVPLWLIVAWLPYSTLKSHIALFQLLKWMQHLEIQRELPLMCTQNLMLNADTSWVIGNKRCLKSGIMAGDPQCNVLNWNVRGLNNPARRQVLKDIIVENSCSMICIQETKLHGVDDLIIASTVEQQFLGHYAMLPAEGTRGGIILACFQDFSSISRVSVK